MSSQRASLEHTREGAPNNDGREIRRYLVRLLLLLALGASVMAGLGLYVYRRFDAERGETTRRIGVVKQLGTDGSVRYAPVGEPSAQPREP